MAGTKIQFLWTLLWLFLGWHCIFIAALPVDVGDDTESFHAADTIGVYLNNNTKVWNFTTEPGAKLLLSFSRISIERIFDYITVGEGTIPSSRREFLRWSGEQVEDELMYLSSGHEIWLTFRKDGSVDSSGFEGMVQKVDENFKLTCPDEYRCGNQVCLTRHDICDGFPNCVTGADENCLQYVVVRPFFNLLSTTSKTGASLGANHKYTWVFVTDSDSKLQLSFDFINTEENYDFVTVGEGFDPSANTLLTWSGEERDSLPTVTSTTFAMWLTLSTDENIQATDTFSANLVQIKESQVTCGSGMFNCMNGVCLPSDYVCDDVIHCGSRRDESNENCINSCPFSNRCMDGTCFQGDKKCDGTLDCPDSLDESGCRPVMTELNNNRRHFKEAFQNHIRTIIFTTTEGRLLVTFYLPRRVTRRTEVSVRRDATSILNNVFGDSHYGFYNIYASSTQIELTFSTDSEIIISANVVPTEYIQRCIDEFDCENGLCIPENMYCDGVPQCTNGNDEPEGCEVGDCFKDEGVPCTGKDVDKALKDIDMVPITTGNAQNVAEKLFNVSAETDLISGKNIDSMTEIVEEIVNLGQQAEVGEVTDSVIGIVNNMYNVDSQSIGDSTTVGVLPEALETQLGNSASNSRNFTEIILPNVRAVAAPVNQESLKKGLSFGSSFLGNTSREEPTELIYFSPPTIRAGVSSSENLSSYIELPSSIGDRVKAGVNSSVPLSFVIYKNATIFPLPPETILNGTKVRQVISSQIISASVANMLVENLPDDERVMTKFFSFPVASRCENEENHQCVFWKYDQTSGRGEWSTDGCEMSGMSAEGQVTCLCNHLTSFAVLVHVSKESRTINIVLDIISDIGCVLSVIGLLICVVTILAIKTVRDKQQSHVHINLCIALIAFYLTFLIGIDRPDNPLGCRITSSFIHFFCLSSMAWMSVEAVLLYNLINKLNRTGVKYLLPVGMIFAWGIPLLVALVVAFLDPHDYGCSLDYCFLHPGLAMYLGFILLIVLMFVFNTFVFFMVSCKFACRPISAADDEKKRKEKAYRIRGIILFWLLMGMSWMFGLLAAIPSPLKILFDILFSILMALQGFAMFYLLTVTNSEVEKLVKRFNCFPENMLSRGRSTTKTTQGSQKSQSNDPSGQISSMTDTQKSSSLTKTDETPA
ncbi:Adhesion G protein-coupled receptor L3 [Holothuria leucospilota]|uniref:Adhesion G protein-coupled receptor L3 n=1 Tax=Holothuria leucospilota TaxID=206669 RepID=A0A9Q1CE38_HOLLE|nr:Adhesion G protein-coupled receptor L3 [Holothuria leucospilota]